MGKRKPLDVARYGTMCVPGRADDGSDSAWFVAPVGRRFKPGTAIYIGDGEAAHECARKRAARLNAGNR
jgi:hypothetical protein